MNSDVPLALPSRDAKAHNYNTEDLFYLYNKNTHPLPAERGLITAPIIASTANVARSGSDMNHLSTMYMDRCNQ